MGEHGYCKRVGAVNDRGRLDPSGRTAICCALDHPLDRRQIVECMVEKNKKLLSMVDPSTNMIPLVMAHGSKWWTSRKVTDYLYSATPLETLNAHQAAQIISQGFINKTFGTQDFQFT